MNKVVLDASALLALLNEEKGHEIVEKHLPHSIMSSVNFAEVVSVLSDIGVPQDEAENIPLEIINEIIPFDQSHALAAASFRKTTKALGLSLGDRACLALGKIEGVPLLTADKAWKSLQKQFNIIFIR